jgi:hypothetical protein
MVGRLTGFDAPLQRGVTCRAGRVFRSGPVTVILSFSIEEIDPSQERPTTCKSKGEIVARKKISHNNNEALL